MALTIWQKTKFPFEGRTRALFYGLRKNRQHKAVRHLRLCHKVRGQNRLTAYLQDLRLSQWSQLFLQKAQQEQCKQGVVGWHIWHLVFMVIRSNNHSQGWAKCPSFWSWALGWNGPSNRGGSSGPPGTAWAPWLLSAVVLSFKNSGKLITLIKITYFGMMLLSYHFSAVSRKEAKASFM